MQDKLTEAMLADVPAQSGDVEAVARALAPWLEGGREFDQMPKTRRELKIWSRNGMALINDATQDDALEAATAAIAAMTSAKDAEIAALQAELAEARNECLEQAGLLGMGAERELDLQARLAEAREVPGRIAAWLVSLDGPKLDADAGNAGLQFGVLMQAQEAIEARDWSK